MLKMPRQEYTVKFKTLAVTRVKAGEGIASWRAYGAGRAALLSQGERNLPAR
jgi:hypothetical protein